MIKNRKIFLLLIPVILLAAGQISAKTGSLILAAENGFHLNPYLILSYCFLILRGVVWIIIIKHIDLSTAYPVMSINYVIILIISNLLFNEAITLFNTAGAALITIGILILMHDSLTNNKEY